MGFYLFELCSFFCLFLILDIYIYIKKSRSNYLNFLSLYSFFRDGHHSQGYLSALIWKGFCFQQHNNCHILTEKLLHIQKQKMSNVLSKHLYWGIFEQQLQNQKVSLLSHVCQDMSVGRHVKRQAIHILCIL